MGLSKGFSQNTFGDEQRDDTKMRGFELGPDGFGFGDHYLGGNIPWNVEKYGEYEGSSNAATGFKGFQPSHRGIPMSFNK